MKRCVVLALLLSGVMLCLPRSLSAQFYPGYGYGYGWGGEAGAAALLGADSRQAAIIQARADSRTASQQLSAQQNYVVQSGIRSTLSGQADSRAAAIANQQQQTQDWWFQRQQQQVARQPPSTGSFVAMRVPAAAAPPVDTSIIQWPPLLQEACFAEQRAQIVAPYRRAPPDPSKPAVPPNVGTPNAADYRQMASAVADMKAILSWRLTEGVDTGQYNTAQAFLEKLGQEVSARVGAD